MLIEKGFGDVFERFSSKLVTFFLLDLRHIDTVGDLAKLPFGFFTRFLEVNMPCLPTLMRLEGVLRRPFDTPRNRSRHRFEWHKRQNR